ncbi:MAG: tetratricopeptide repeat protein [Burkholderiales bacterium]|jgi:hypothetical protein|nr:tetratricopeptide repeat protein [Burkholderiales bacterium]
MNRKIDGRLSFVLLFASNMFAVGVVNAAENTPVSPMVTAQSSTEEKKSQEEVAAPTPINISAVPAELLSGDILSVHDGTTVRPSTNYEVLIMDFVYRFNEAIRNNNLIEAESQLRIMKQFLPEQSLTLLRMRAWYALSANQEAEARKLYRQLLDRVANDENAGINLAILEARSGRVDEAKKILNDLANRIPYSEQLNIVRQAFGLVRTQ